LGFYQDDAKGLFLGEEFHHNRNRIICSQIEGIKPELHYKWDRKRLNRTIMDLQLENKLRLKGLITHNIRFEDAKSAYECIEKSADSVLQIVLFFQEV
jgi:threonine dehydrogenase-like Zn-dependent dehydrogenase